MSHALFLLVDLLKVLSSDGPAASFGVSYARPGYSDLFALVEDIEDPKASKPSRSRGKMATTAYKNASKNKHVVQDSDTDTDSSEDEETFKSKPARKKKRTTMACDLDSD
ncbi:hypothetical protein LAZ67_14002898 [Cordylochernes scorpioides]|uniref:Uncharacterized protein n=1 Tax=Cordylochernes scorpioides TaxID=51811 RepID=A0ABY6L980_9ARAC|nr:hypothetical protein LAZ67_14002898 [Cordylochernes scorpioides]